MHDIANLSKHSKLERSKSQFKELIVYAGDSFSFQDPPFIKIVMNDGTFFNGTKML